MGQEEVKENLFFFLKRPRSYWDVICIHFPLWLVAASILLPANFISINQLPLKHCTFLSLTGYPCPFCGFTRSIWAIAQGNWEFAFYNSPLACLLYLLAIVMFAWNTAALMLGVRLSLGRLFRIRRIQTRWLTLIISSIFLLNWGYRLSLGLT